MEKNSFYIFISFLNVQLFLFNQTVFAQDTVDNSENVNQMFKSSNTGFTPFLVLPFDYFSNVSGGIKNEDSYMLNASLGMSLDLELLAGLKGTAVYFSVIGIKGVPFLENTGAIQGISNIAGLNQRKLYEAWIEQNLFDKKFSILVGLYDLNSEFDVRESSIYFINPSFGIGFDFSQSGSNGPSIFPYTSLAVRIKARLSDTFEIIGAVFDGVPGSLNNESFFQVKLSAEEGALIATELIYYSQNNFLKISFGGWYYTSTFETILDENKESGNFGAYLNAEKLIYSEESNSSQGLSLFGRIGFAHTNFNPSDYTILGGIDYKGIIPGRDEDIFGLACSSIHLSDKFKQLNNLDSNFETIFELTYNLQINEWLRIQPDLQYILNPVLAPEADYAFVAGVRTEISL